MMTLETRAATTMLRPSLAWTPKRTFPLSSASRPFESVAAMYDK